MSENLTPPDPTPEQSARARILNRVQDAVDRAERLRDDLAEMDDNDPQCLYGAADELCDMLNRLKRRYL